MTKSDISIRIKEVFAKHLNIRFSEVADSLVIGRRFTTDEDLQLDLACRVGVPMFVNTPTATIGQLIKTTEGQWDMMADWERERLATA